MTDLAVRLRLNRITISRSSFFCLLLVSLARLASAAVLGPQSVLVIRVNFTANPTETMTDAQTQTQMDGVDQFYRRGSYEQASITTTIAPWVTIPHDAATCDFQPIAQAADALVTALGYSMTAYKVRAYHWPHLNCGWAGLTSYAFGNVSQLRVFSNGEFDLRVVGHEIGHAFNIFHANAFRCSDAPFGSVGCSSANQGDPFDLMGSGLGDFNVVSKGRLGWTSIAQVCADGVYALDLLETMPIGFSKGLRVQLTNVFNPQSLVIERRQNVAGLLIRVAWSYPNFVANDLLYDMTTATNTWNDAALLDGQSVTYPGVVTLRALQGGNVDVAWLTSPPGCQVPIPGSAGPLIPRSL